MTTAQGPLTGIRLIEFAGIGPGPFCGMLLSDLGAEIVRIDRPGSVGGQPFDVTKRGRRSVTLDLKRPESIAICLRLIERADGLFEGFRPGVMERLGLGPDIALTRNPKLVYGRMTGWGQDGPLAQAAGHDINYIALSGALHAIGPGDAPVPPLNIVGDFGGGALYLAMGLLAGILHARQSGQGQVVDCAITDGAASLMAVFYGAHSAGRWQDARAANLLDGGAHFYNTYRCADGKFVSIGSIEPQFYALLLDKVGIDDPLFQQQLQRENWPELRKRLAHMIEQRTQREWCTLLEGSDACFAPVLGLADAPRHPHHQARKSLVDIDGIVQPAPAPRFSKTPGQIQSPPPAIGAHNREALADWGFSGVELDQLHADGLI